MIEDLYGNGSGPRLPRPAKGTRWSAATVLCLSSRDVVVEDDLAVPGVLEHDAGGVVARRHLGVHIDDLR